MEESINPDPTNKLFITPSLANNILKANERSNSLIQKGIIKETTNNLAVLGLATFAI